MQKNDVTQLLITGLTHEGHGVGRVDGRAVFVPRTAPGDEVEAKILKVNPAYAHGRVERLLTPSPHRVENDCPVFGRCGGCALRHISYPTELEIKQSWVSENLARIGKVFPDWEPIQPSPKIQRYRNKAQYPVRLVEGRVRTGFFAPRSHALIPVEDCILHPEFFADICRAVCAFCEEKAIPPYDEAGHTGLLRQVCIRHGEATGQTLVCLVVNGKTFPFAEALGQRLEKLCPGPLSFHVNRNRERTNVIMGSHTRHVSGPGAIEDVLAGVRVRLSPQSFYQVNREAAELLYKTALEYADPSADHTLLDLYCGAGVIGLSMAERVGSLIGVESVPQAVEDASQNASLGGITNARFICASAAQAAQELKEQGVRPDTIIVDPPRKGLCSETIEQLAAMSPAKIVYLSCNSATLARDCAALAKKGYRAVRGRAVDLFPRTAHVECVVQLVADSLAIERGVN